jgi:transcriptional regulator with XRE-family HTH domain
MGQGPTLDDDDEASALTPLGEFMLRRNAELGLSVSAVAQRVGMSRATWYRMARGESASPSLQLLRGLARVYKVRAHELFTLAASTDPSPPAAVSPQDTLRAAEAGDALWRCRYDRQVRPGALLEVQLELLNLSRQPWQGAEVHALHDGWLLLGNDPVPSQPACSAGYGLPRCSSPLPSTGPQEWALASLALRAPLVAGAWVFCLALRFDPQALPAGAGAFLCIEAR